MRSATCGDDEPGAGAARCHRARTGRREHGFGRDVVELLLAHSEKNATVAADSHMALAADRKRALQYRSDRVEALGAGATLLPLRAA